MLQKIVNNKILRVANIIWVPMSFIALFLTADNLYSFVSILFLFALTLFETLLLSVAAKLKRLTQPKLAILLVYVLSCILITIYSFLTLVVNAGLDGFIEFSLFIVLMTIGFLIVFSNDIDMRK